MVVIEDEIEAVHVFPVFGPAHRFNTPCWCQPVIEYCSCGCGQELIAVHNAVH